MRIPRRYTAPPNSTVHKIWRCHNKEYLLEKATDKHEYLQAIHDDYTGKCNKDDFEICGYVVMSNHAHESDTVGERTEKYSEHMRRSYGRFGLRFNKRHERLGKVALDRPKTIRMQDAKSHMRVMFYSDCNPVRAGIIRHPTDTRWKDFSSCRFYAYGERNRYSDMLTPPAWYLALGRTQRARQRRYRSLLDRYMIEHGLKRDPKMCTGYFLGGEQWIQEQRKLLRERTAKLAQAPP